MDKRLSCHMSVHLSKVSSLPSLSALERGLPYFGSQSLDIRRYRGRTALMKAETLCQTNSGAQEVPCRSSIHVVGDDLEKNQQDLKALVYRSYIAKDKQCLDVQECRMRQVVGEPEAFKTTADCLYISGNLRHAPVPSYHRPEKSTLFPCEEAQSIDNHWRGPQTSVQSSASPCRKCFVQ